jgi:hypothetical protein
MTGAIEKESATGRSALRIPKVPRPMSKKRGKGLAPVRPPWSPPRPVFPDAFRANLSVSSLAQPAGGALPAQSRYSFRAREGNRPQHSQVRSRISCDSNSTFANRNSNRLRSRWVPFRKSRRPFAYWCVTCHLRTEGNDVDFLAIIF